MLASRISGIFEPSQGNWVGLMIAWRLVIRRDEVCTYDKWSISDRVSNCCHNTRTTLRFGESGLVACYHLCACFRAKEKYLLTLSLLDAESVTKLVLCMCECTCVMPLRLHITFYHFCVSRSPTVPSTCNLIQDSPTFFQLNSRIFFQLDQASRISCLLRDSKSQPSQSKLLILHSPLHLRVLLLDHQANLLTPVIELRLQAFNVAFFRSHLSPKMSAMNVDSGPFQSSSCLSNVSIPNTFASNGYQTQTYEQLEAAALNWASQREADIQQKALASVAQHHTILEQRAAEWKARELAECERQALAWRAREEVEVKSRLEAWLAEIKQQAETQHARMMAQEKAEHTRLMEEERARTTEARRLSEARSTEIQKLQEEGKRLQAKIEKHEEAAKSQRQGAEKQHSQVQSLQQSLAEKDLELQEKSKSNTELQQRLESSKLELMRALVCGSQKNVEIVSLREDKNTLILQGNSAIAAKDRRCFDLEDTMYRQVMSLQDRGKEIDRLEKIAKDLTKQKEKLQVENSKLDTELETALEKARNEKKQHLAAMKKANRELGKEKDKKGTGDITRLMGAVGLGASSANGISKPRPPPRSAQQARRHRRRSDATDSESQAMDESDG